MPPIPGMVHWHSLVARHARSLREAIRRVSRALDAQLTGETRAAAELVPIRTTPKQSLHPLARIRQGQSRWFSTARRSLDRSVRHISSTSAPTHSRSSFPKSRVSAYIAQSSGRAPFASTLRPNLTGGTLGRTAGGYTVGSGRIGGVRHFSHGPTSPAQVIQNVSQGVRAFVLGGYKAQYDGVSSISGEKRFKTVSVLQAETGRKLQSVPRTTPGSWIEFQINPTITALTPLKACGNSMADHLNTEGLMDILSIDFSRALKELAATLNDLARLSSLGDLPITHEQDCIRVHFPGCDADTVQRLCDELNIQRGNVIQDDQFDTFAGTEIALLFPFAPSHETSLTSESNDGACFYDVSRNCVGNRRPVIDLNDMLDESESLGFSTLSETGLENVLAEENPWLSSPSGFQSVRSRSTQTSDQYSPLEYQGFEGIYRFIEQLDAVRR